MTDVEIIEAQAKEASRLRAIEAVKEKSRLMSEISLEQRAN